MSAPAVSVIVPAYRAARFLPDAVAQLEAQTLDEEFEVILVDDGSGDDTADTVRALAAAHVRVTGIVLPQNVGVARARKAAVDAARGEYLWFVDADDAWPEDALRVLLSLARNMRADIAVAGAVFVYPGGGRRLLQPPVSPPTSGRDAFRMLLRGELTGHLWNKLFRRDVMARASFAPAKVQSDLVMVADALARAGRVAFTTSPVYEYRLREGSIITSASRRADSLSIIDGAVRRCVIHLGLTASLDYRYFRARYIQLSGIKDALNAEYSPAERTRLLTARRRSLTVRDVMVFARRRDVRRLALAATAKTSVRAHRALLAVAER